MRPLPYGPHGALNQSLNYKQYLLWLQNIYHLIQAQTKQYQILDPTPTRELNLRSKTDPERDGPRLAWPMSTPT